ncbi:MAG: nitrogen fixation protein FixH [Rhodoferax sp.]
MSIDCVSARGPQQAADRAPPQRAWANPYVWLVAAGPAVVVAASMFTLWLALRTPEVSVLETPSPARVSAAQGRPDMAPAMQGRNHAATGGLAQAQQPGPAAQSPGPKAAP